jgi:transposase
MATPSVALRYRTRGVRTIAIPDVKSSTLQAHIKEHVEPGSVIYTDGLQCYLGLENSGFSHKVINHDKTFASGNENHTNTIEGYWRLSKNKLCTRYHKISAKRLPEYLAESEFKFNHRHNPDFIRLVLSKLIFRYP